MKTKEEVEHLKQNWLSDPCYDLEKEEGFEEYHDELLTFREEHERQWSEARHAQLMIRARSLGLVNIDGRANLNLTQYILNLEERLTTLEGIVDFERERARR